MRRFIAFLIFCTLSCSGVVAQSVSFTSSAPLNVSEGQRFQVQLSLKNGSGEDFSAPTFEGLSVLSGPNISHGSQYSFVNGVQTSSTSVTYTYFVEAQAGKTRGTISQASIVVGGKKYTTKPLVISIMNGSGQSGTQGTQQGGGEPIQYHQNNGLEANDILLRLNVSKTNPYVGEAVSAQLKLYTRVGIAGLNNPKYPALSGFWTQEIEVPQNAQSNRVTIDGKAYESFTLRQWLLYPQKAGKVTIDATSLDVLAQISSRSSGTSLFDQFFGGGSSVSNINRHLTTGKKVINVRSLPSGAPVGSTPSVGNFNMESTISDTVISANSAGSLSVTIQGTGDFPLMGAPSFRLPAEFEQYDTKTTENLRNTLNGSSGSRTYEFPFVARSEGEYTIPAVEFVYFDIKSGSYKTLRSEEYRIKVNRDTKAGASSSLITGVNREDLEILSNDIRYIKIGEMSGSKSLMLYSWVFFLILLALVGVGILAVIYLRKVASLRADVVGSRTRKASKVALRRLRNARREMDGGRKGEFFEEIMRSMLGFVGDKYSISISELTKERIFSEFDSRGVSEEVSKEFIAIIEVCEMARYAPSAIGEMRPIYDRTLKAFDSL